MVNHNGRAYYVPVSELEKTQINSLFRWQQAFRVFCDIFTPKYPAKSAELMQYNHTIHTAASSAPWENVASYDRVFRRHMACHPLRSWGIILQQAWTFHIKDSGSGKGHNQNFQRNDKGTPNRKRDLYWRFNRGKCSYGMNCKFDHRCGVCGKFGHGAHNCRKLGMECPGNNRARGEWEDKQGRSGGDRFHYFATECRAMSMKPKGENK